MALVSLLLDFQWSNKHRALQKPFDFLSIYCLFESYWQEAIKEVIGNILKRNRNDFRCLETWWHGKRLTSRGWHVTLHTSTHTEKAWTGPVSCYFNCHINWRTPTDINESPENYVKTLELWIFSNINDHMQEPITQLLPLFKKQSNNQLFNWVISRHVLQRPSNWKREETLQSVFIYKMKLSLASPQSFHSLSRVITWQNNSMAFSSEKSPIITRASLSCNIQNKARRKQIKI